MRRKWQIRVAGTLKDVAGFTQVSRAREHVEKHFFNANERWEQVVGDSTPIQLRNRFSVVVAETGRKCSPEAYKLLDEALEVYMSVIEGSTTENGALRIVCYTHKPDGGGKPFPAISVVSRKGVFSAFSQGAVSDLKTSFRPKLKRSYRGRCASQDYQRAALNYLNTKLSHSQEIFGN